MKLEVDATYITKAGNAVKCLIRFKDGTYLGQYEKTIEGHESLLDKTYLWLEDGSWLAYPHGIHDIIKRS